jgi:hypothetical protein
MALPDNWLDALSLVEVQRWFALQLAQPTLSNEERSVLQTWYPQAVLTWHQHASMKMRATEWRPGQTYRELDLVFHADVFYRCIKTHTGSLEPPNETVWRQFGVRIVW